MDDVLISKCKVLIWNKSKLRNIAHISDLILLYNEKGIRLVKEASYLD